MKRLKTYLFNIALSFDRMANAIFFGDPGETISSRCAKCTDCLLCKPICWFTGLIDKNHCEDSIELTDEQEREYLAASKDKPEGT